MPGFRKDVDNTITDWITENIYFLFIDKKEIRKPQ